MLGVVSSKSTSVMDYLAHNSPTETSRIRKDDGEGASADFVSFQISSVGMRSFMDSSRPILGISDSNNGLCNTLASESASTILRCSCRLMEWPNYFQEAVVM